MVGGKGGIAAALDQETSNAGVIGTDAVDDQKDDLVDGEAEQESEAGGDQRVAGLRALRADPPLGSNGDNQQRHATGGGENHDPIGKSIAGQRVDPPGQAASSSYMDRSFAIIQGTLNRRRS